MPTESLAPMAIVRDLRTVILLAGRVGPSEFADGVQRSVLDLPVDGRRRVLDIWAERFDELARLCGLDRMLVRIAIDRDSRAPDPRPASPDARVTFEVVRDRDEYRGTAGVVRDLTADLRDSELVMVAQASQIQREPLARALAQLEPHGEGVSVVPVAGSELVGFFLLRRARFRDVPDIGFVDLKEQAIPVVQGSLPLPVVRRPPGANLPIRTLDEYLRALRGIYAAPVRAGAPDPALDPFAETWKSTFAIVEDGADVAPDAVIQDAVVLRGGRVEDRAVVARSVVCPGGVVRRGEACVEGLVRG